MPRILLGALRPSRTAVLQLALGGAVVLAFAILVLRAGEDPGIEVQRRDPAPGVDEIRVEVSGSVAQPGVVTVRPGDRVADAIALAGGLEPDADTAAVNLAMRLRDEDRVVVPRIGEGPPLLDINTASAEDLDALPGIGPVYSARIVEARELGGPFATTGALLERDVIPEHVYDGIRQLIAAR